MGFFCCHVKIPVLDRLVEPPTTTKKIQSKCANLLLKAAENIVLACPDDIEFSLVSVTLSFPLMHSSEICINFDKSTLEKSFNRDNKYLKISLLDKSIESTKLYINIPPVFSVIGFFYQCFDDEYTFETESWYFYEKKHQELIHEKWG